MNEQRAKGLCQDCRWWTDTVRVGDVPKMILRPGWGACQLAGVGAGGREHHGDSLAYATPFEYAAWLETAPDFGCVQFAVSVWGGTVIEVTDGLRTVAVTFPNHPLESDSALLRRMFAGSEE